MGLVLTFFLAGLIVVSVIKYLSKSINIYFDEDYMYMVYDGNTTEKYLKKDIAGFYSYNYEQIEKSFISIQIFLKNGTKIELTDINLSEKTDKEKAQMLKRFLMEAKKELNFTLVGKSRVRSLQKLGAAWYTNTNKEEHY